MAKSTLLKAALVSSAIAMTFTAQAAQVYFGGVTPTDDSQQTSGRAEIEWLVEENSNIIDPSSGFFIETFDLETVNPILAQANPPLTSGDNTGPVEIEGNSGCSFNSFNAVDITASPVGAGMGIQKGNTGQAAHDNANSTCFAYAPQINENATADITVDYADFLNGAPLGYVGIYYGSIDSYNGLEFGNVVDNVFNPISLTIGGVDYGTTLDGTEILNIKNLQSGNRDSSNVYVNVLFDADEVFTAFRLRNSNSRALEVDNIVVGLASAIPEPASLAVFGLGLLGLAGARRRKS